MLSHLVAGISGGKVIGTENLIRLVEWRPSLDRRWAPKPTIAAISGDMPPNRVGFSLAFNALITIPSPSPSSRRVFYPYPHPIQATTAVFPLPQPESIAWPAPAFVPLASPQ